MDGMGLDLAHWMGLALAIFAGGFLDAVAGGGGMITVPAFLAAGLPAAAALGTNKLVSVTGGLTSTIQYSRAGLVRRSTLPLALFSLVASVGGALCATLLEERTLKLVLMSMLLTALVALNLRPGEGFRRREDTGWPRWIPVGALALGFYDGFFGPGTGSFLILLLAAAGLEMTQASGNAKLLNFASNLGAAILFASRGSMRPVLALTLVPMMVAGSWTGANFAVKRGAPAIRFLLAVVVVALVGKLGWDMLRG